MSVFGEKSSRLAVANGISLTLMVIIGVLIGILSDKIGLITMPILIGVINLFMIVEYFATPHHMMSLFETRLTIRKSFGRVIELDLRDVESITVTRYSVRSDAGILAIGVKGKRPILVQAIREADAVREMLFNECSRYGFANAYDLPSIENGNTSHRVSTDDESQDD